jgi:hypothetical protein
MKPHKWAKEIKAWADGAEIESKNIATGEWVEVDPYWDEDDEYEYRIKSQSKEPQPKEPQYLYVYFNAEMVSVYKEPIEGWDSVLLGKIKLEVDDE